MWIGYLQVLIVKKKQEFHHQTAPFQVWVVKEAKEKLPVKILTWKEIVQEESVMKKTLKLQGKNLDSPKTNQSFSKRVSKNTTLLIP